VAEQMRHKLGTAEGQAVYKLRKAVVEPHGKFVLTDCYRIMIDFWALGRRPLDGDDAASLQVLRVAEFRSAAADGHGRS
jgi:hypothetical protein